MAEGAPGHPGSMCIQVTATGGGGEVVAVLCALTTWEGGHSQSHELPIAPKTLGPGLKRYKNIIFGNTNNKQWPTMTRQKDVFVHPFRVLRVE